MQLNDLSGMLAASICGEKVFFFSASLVAVVRRIVRAVCVCVSVGLCGWRRIVFQSGRFWHFVRTTSEREFINIV